ncbi:hypothetical protein B296_00059224 [Ensete ventricosum]|uniref:Uncharacterized protein n=1 Tax=Ensete ventricosum TaxID=4639 RepID=A0A426XIQ9_ENSVE|nr:hypothetical protein B296_00059224 [Ensete ventricosum]
MKTPRKGRAGVFVEERRGERWRRAGTRRSYSPMQTKLVCRNGNRWDRSSATGRRLFPPRLLLHVLRHYCCNREIQIVFYLLLDVATHISVSRSTCEWRTLFLRCTRCMSGRSRSLEEKDGFMGRHLLHANDSSSERREVHAFTGGAGHGTLLLLLLLLHARPRLQSSTKRCPCLAALKYAQASSS